MFILILRGLLVLLVLAVIALILYRLVRRISVTEDIEEKRRELRLLLKVEETNLTAEEKKRLKKLQKELIQEEDLNVG